MIFRNLTDAGDWTFGQGRQNYLTGDAAIAMNLRTRLKCFLNDCFFATDFGIDWWNLLGAKNPGAQANLLLSARAVIAGSEGVVRINSVEAVTDRRTRRLTLRANVDTIFSRGIVLAVQP